MTRSVLIIEDNPAIAELVSMQVSDLGMAPVLASRGDDGLARFRQGGIDLVVLDLMLPGLDGLAVCREIRTAADYVPVLMLTAKSTELDRVLGLEMGADDYLTKPFNKDELIARITAIVRRSKGHAESVIRTGEILVNLDAKTVEVDGNRVHLTGKEYAMLELLSLRKGTTLTKEMFLNHLYGGMDEPELKIIDVFICKLRKKLSTATGGDSHIETVWGRGYVLRDPEALSDDAERLAIGA